jgi:hypothetical protein
MREATRVHLTIVQRVGRMSLREDRLRDHEREMEPAPGGRHSAPALAGPPSIFFVDIFHSLLHFPSN